jgi:hypothetical protein
MRGVERIPFVFKNNITTIETVRSDDGRLFFNATELWQMNGSPDVYSVEDYVKADQTKELMLFCYLKNQKLDNIRDIIKQIRGEMGGQSKLLKDLSDHIDISVLDNKENNYQLTADDVRDLFLNTNLNGHLSKIEQHFIQIDNSSKKENSDYFIENTLFLDYSMRLSVQLKSQILNVFQKYGWLEGLNKNDRIEALMDLIDLEQGKY